MEASGCVGHLRVDMGSNGLGFYPSWDNHTPELNDTAFKAEFDDVINDLRGDMLKDRSSLANYCRQQDGSVMTEDGRNFGFRVNTDTHAYIIRLNPHPGEYAAYVYAYDRDMLDNQLAALTEPEKLTVLVVEPENIPYTKEIDPGLKPLQEAVGGYIQAIYPYDDPVAIVCNEEGKLDGLPLNRALRDKDNHIYDIIAGTFLVVGLGEEDFCSLPQDLQSKYSDVFKTPEMFMKMNGKLVVLPMEPSIPSPTKRTPSKDKGAR